MPDTPRFDDWVRSLTPRNPRERVHKIATEENIPSDLADDYLRLTQVESGHNVNVRPSSKGALGFGQVMPDAPGTTTRTVGNRRFNLRDPDQNIAAGLNYFAEGGSDPIARRLHYFAGPGARRVYERTGRIPNVSDGNMTAEQYVRATGGYFQQEQPAQPTRVPRFDDWAKSQQSSQPSEQTPPPVREDRIRKPASIPPRAPSAPIRHRPPLFGAEPSEQERELTRQAIERYEQNRQLPRIDTTIPNLLNDLQTRPPTFEEDRAARIQRQQAISQLRQRAARDFNEEEYRNYLLVNRSLDSPRQREAFLDLRAKQMTAAAGGSPYAALTADTAEQERKQRAAQIGTLERVAQVPASVLTGAASSAGTALKGLAVAGRALVDRVTDTRGFDTRDSYIYQLGEMIQQEAPRILRSNPDLEQEFLVGKVPSTLGQAATFMLGGWASKSPKLAVTILGGGMTAGDAYDEVRRAGGSDEDAINAGLLAGAILGPTELIGLRGATKALSGTVQEATLKQALKTALQEGRKDIIENAVQELGQEYLQGRITGVRRSERELLEAALLGGVGGTVTIPLTLATGTSGRRRGRATTETVEAQPPVEAPRAEVESVERVTRGVEAVPARIANNSAVLPTMRDTSDTVAEQAGAPVEPAAATGSAVPQRYSHVQFGNIVRADDQTGARKGRVKVYEESNPDAIHYVRNVDLRGRGNERMVPLREPAPTPAPATEITPEQRAREYAAVDAEIAERRGSARDPNAPVWSPEKRAEMLARLNDVPPPEPSLAQPAEPPVTEVALPANETASSPIVTEPVTELSRPRPTTPKDAAMQADRAELGLPELEQLPRVRAQEVLDEAQQRSQTNPRSTDTLVDQALKGGKNFTNVETMQVNLRAQEVKNRLNEINNEVYREVNPERLADLRAESDTLLGEFDRISQAQDKAGAEWSRAGTARQRAIAEDYSLVGLVARAKKAKGRDLTTEERTRYEQQAGRIAELESQLTQAQARTQEQALNAEIKRLSRQRARSQTKQSLDVEYAQLITEFHQARAETRNVQASGLAALDPEGKLTRIILRMARNRVLAGVNNATQLIDEIYTAVREHLPEATERDIRDAISGYSLTPKTQRSNLQKQLDTLKSELQSLSKKEDVAAGIRSPKREGPTPGEIRRVRPSEGPRQIPHGPPSRLFTRNEQRASQVAEQIADLERRIAEKDFTLKPKKERLPYTKEVQRLEEQLQHTKNKFELEMQRAQPGHWLRQLSGIRKSWMLSGLSTQAKNIGGTGAYQVFDEIARLPAVIADAAVAPFTNRRTITANPVAMLDSVIHAATVGRREAGQILRQGATQEQLERHQFAEIDTGIKLVDFTSNLVFRFMSASDRVFYQYAHQRNLNDRARAQALNEGAGNIRARTKELVTSPSEDMDAAAKHDALVSTFNNNNLLSNAIKRARAQMGPTSNFAIDMIMPFDRTPTNVIARIIEASPIGGTVAATRLAKGLVSKSLTAEQQRQFTQTLGRATVGTALMALGWALADSLLDIEKYQVFLNLGKQRIDLASVSPIGNLLALGARLREDYKKGDATGAVKTVGGVPLQQPLLKGTTEAVEAISDPERSLTRTGSRLASSFIPMGGLVRDVGKLIDPEDRRARTFKEQVQQNIPVLRQRLPVRPRPRKRLQLSAGRPQVGTRP